MHHVLIILGDVLSRFVQATGVIQDIRDHHPQSHIVLLTTPNLGQLAETNPHLDNILYDTPQPFWNLPAKFHLRRFLEAFDTIYDLQHDQRSKSLMKLSDPLKWSSCHAGAGMYVNSRVFKNHSAEDALRVQLSMAHVPTQHRPDLSYATQPADQALAAIGIDNPRRYTYLIPGSRQTHKHRRWPHYHKLAAQLKAAGHPVAIIGGLAEERLTHRIADDLDIPLLYNWPLSLLIDVFQKAHAIVGNDAGPIYIAAVCQANGIVLFGPTPGRQRHLPQFSNIQILQHGEKLAAISPQDVVKTLTSLSHS